MYMFALCALLMDLGFFKEIQISFLSVEHIHKDIDQEFRIISKTLKKTDIDLIKEMFIPLEKGTSPKEVFVRVQHLENVRDWKAFITPYLLRGSKALVDTTSPHHMRFYMQNGKH